MALNRGIFIIPLLGVLAAISARAETPAENTENWSTFAFIGFESWQSTASILDASGNSFPLVANQIGICPGVGVTRALGSPFEFQASACGVLAMSNILSTNAGSASYSAIGSHVTGSLLEVGVLWIPVDIPHAKIGLSVPVLFQSADWADPAAGFTLSGKTSTLVGAEITPEFEYERVLISPRVGFLSTIKDFALNFRVGYRF